MIDVTCAISKYGGYNVVHGRTARGGKDLALNEASSSADYSVEELDGMTIKFYLLQTFPYPRIRNRIYTILLSILQNVRLGSVSLHPRI